jgi:hypothetical protein
MKGMTTWFGAGWIASAAILVLATCGGRAALEPVEQLASGGHGAGGHTTTSTGTGATGAGGTTTTSTTNSWSTNSWTTSSWTTSTTGTCDGAGDCQTCADCATSGPCVAQMDACMGNDACIAFFDCMDVCTNPDPWTCYSQCSQSNPTGAQLYSDLLWCAVCGQCTSDCSAMASWWCYNY